MKWLFNRLPMRAFICLVIVAIGLSISVVTLLNPRSARQSVPIGDKPAPQVRGNQTFAPDTTPLPKQAAAHLVSKVQTTLPVVFLTMDDGQHKDERAVEFIERRQWPVSLFLADAYTKENYGYFKKLVQNGATVQNHTLSHHYLTKLTYQQQKNEICGASDKSQEIYGQRPTFLRPPGGHYDASTFSSAYACGISTVVMWSAKVDGGAVQFQRGDRLVPGDIVLMHFRPKIMEDLAAFEAEIIKHGLYVAKLEDWVRIVK